VAAAGCTVHTTGRATTEVLMDLLRLSRGEAGFVIGVPLAWAVLLLFHPGGTGKEIYADLDGDGTRMLIVHVGTMVFIPSLPRPSTC
jgi:hypothetical protein